MELLPDGSLRDRLRDGPLPPDVVATIGADVAAAVAHIHARGIVHRDVKPANVLLRRADEGELRGTLTDFGIARLLESATATTSAVIGTALYVSPEQAQGHPVDPSSDVYSLGLTLLEALTGRPAFPGTIAESLTARLLRDPQVPAGFGYGWRSLLGAMTARDPGQRPTAEQVADRLRVIALEDGVADTVELRTATLPLPVPLRRPARRRVRVALAAAAITVGLTTAGSLVGATPAFGPSAEGAAAAAAPTTSQQPTATPTPRTTAGSASGGDRTAVTTVATTHTRTATAAKGSGPNRARPKPARHPSGGPAKGGPASHGKPKPEAAKPGKPAGPGQGPGPGHGPKPGKGRP